LIHYFDISFSLLLIHIILIIISHYALFRLFLLLYFDIRFIIDSLLILIFRLLILFILMLTFSIIIFDIYCFHTCFVTLFAIIIAIDIDTLRHFHIHAFAFTLFASISDFLHISAIIDIFFDYWCIDIIADISDIDYHYTFHYYCWYIIYLLDIISFFWLLFQISFSLLAWHWADSLLILIISLLITGIFHIIIDADRYYWYSLAFISLPFWYFIFIILLILMAATFIAIGWPLLMILFFDISYYYYYYFMIDTIDAAFADRDFRLAFTLYYFLFSFRTSIILLLIFSYALLIHYWHYYLYWYYIIIFLFSIFIIFISHWLSH